GELVLGEHGLFLPGVRPVLRRARQSSVDPVAATHRLAAVAPGRDAARVDDLTLHVEAADQERVAFILEVLEHRARVLPHENGVRRIVVDAELIADSMLLAEAMQRNPR